MNRKHNGRFSGFTAFLTVMVSALLMISLGACPNDAFDDVEQIAGVVAAPASGVVPVGQVITLTCTTPGVSIYYTLDSSTPSMTNGTLYGDTTKPVITTPATLKAIAIKSDMADSPVLTASYTNSANVVATPTANPGAGVVGAGTSITLTSATSGASIYYTTDGTTPTSASTLYTGAVVITTSTTLKAIAVQSGMTDSGVLTAEYTVYMAPSWTAEAVTNFYDEWIYSVASNGGDTFVGGGYASVLSYSSDGGNTWTYIAYPFFALGDAVFSIQSIAYGNNTFVAVGGNGNIAYASSSDVTQWTAVTTSNFPIITGGTIYGVAYGNGKFVAVGDDGKIVYAPETDLQNWTLVDNSTFDSSNIQGITYGEGKFVAVSEDGKMALSTDGIAWTAVANSTFGGTAIFDIAWGEDIFVAVGASGKMAWSDDGLIWNAISSTFASNADINGICYGNGQFIAVSGDRTVGLGGAIAGSPDGKTWAAVIDTPDVNDFTVTLYDVAYGNGRFVAGGGAGVLALSTPC
jgi:hypothetical protein